MNQWKRLVYYLLINVLVSACTTIAVLYFWERSHPTAPGVGQPLVLNVSGSQDQPVSAAALLTGTPGPALTEAVTQTATDQPTQDPYANAIAYEVKPADTMGEIARKFDVPLEDLLSYNALTNADALSVGQVIYIPVTPQPTPSETPAPQETASVQASGSPAAASVPARVLINSVIGPGDLASERVFLSRSGEGPLSLSGWRLEDEDGNVFIFPQIELYNDGAVNVWTTTGTDTVVDLYWGLSSPVWESGEEVRLLDDQGKVQATDRVP